MKTLKNYIGKTLGIACLFGASFMPMEDVAGQDATTSDVNTSSLSKNYKILLGKSSLRNNSRWHMTLDKVNDPKQITLLDSIYTLKVPLASEYNHIKLLFKKGTKISISDTSYFNIPSCKYWRTFDSASLIRFSSSIF